MREDLAEILRQALAAFGEKIAELQQTRAQLLQLLEEAPARTTVNPPATKPRKGLSAEARAKISSAQKARWAKDRKERREEQQPIETPPTVTQVKPAQIRVRRTRRSIKPEAAPLKAKLIKAGSAQIKEIVEPQNPESSQAVALFEPTAPAAPIAVKLPMETTKAATKATFRRSAKRSSGFQRDDLKSSQASKPDAASPAGIVEQLALAGARFRITRGGSLIVGNLASLPPAVQQLFINYPNPHLLTAAARRHLADAGQSSTY